MTSPPPSGLLPRRAAQHVQRHVAHFELALLDMGAQQTLGFVRPAAADGAQDAGRLVVGGRQPRRFGETKPPE